MIALVVTFVVAAYLLGPELLSRWVLGFVVPRKNVVETKGEEVTRALVWAALPLIVSLGWTKFWWTSHGYGRATDIQVVFSGLYSDAYFQSHHDLFFSALRTVWWMNFAVMWRLYLIVAVISVTLDFIVLRYQYLRQRWWGRILTAVVARLTLPKISEWHLLLSGMLLPNKNFELHADVLTKGGILYQGKVTEKILGPEGKLETLTLSDPRRFLREQFQENKKRWQSTKSEDYWRPIPGNLFVIFGSEIASMNLRYLDRNLDVTKISDAERAVIERLLQKLTEPQRQ
jgi:hypothetical protein